MNLDEVKAYIATAEDSFDSTGYQDFRLGIGREWVTASCWDGDKHICAVGRTFAECLSQMRAKMETPSDKAKRLREDARKLLREAVELEVKHGGAL